MKVKVECVFGCYETNQHGDPANPVAACPVHGFERVRALLREQCEDEDSRCSFDHHGYCQEHGSFGEPGECLTKDSREAVGLA